MDKINFDIPKVQKILELHGDTRIDNYFWLNQRQNPEVLKYIENENLFAQKFFANSQELMQQLCAEMQNRIEKDDKSVPVWEDGYFYYTKYLKDSEYPIYCRKKYYLEADENIILDVNLLAAEHKYFDLEDYAISHNNSLIAYSYDTTGRKLFNIKIKNIFTETLFDEEIKNTDGSIAWANDNSTIFYILKNENTLREYKIMKHKLGTPTTEDTTVYVEKNQQYFLSLSKSKSEKYIFIEAVSTNTTETLYIDANHPDSKPKIFNKRKRNIEYYLQHANDTFYIRTNYKALNFNIMTTTEDNTNIENWTELTTYNKNIFIEDFEIFKNYMVILQKTDGLNKFNILNLTNKQYTEIRFDEEVFAIDFNENPTLNTTKFRFFYSSPATPSSIFEYDLSTEEKVLLKQQKILGEFNQNDYKTERHFAIAKDKTKIPISIVYKKNINLYNNNPTLIYGYGAYGYSMENYFAADIISLLDRGYVYAIAHIRGGEEMGRQWYKKGKMLNKMNTFYDFIACSEYLIQKNISSKDKLIAQGGSAGGLLMGVIANLRPEIYKVIIAEVPFVDVITTMIDENIPLTTLEYDEWGDPNILKYYNYIKQYSPYDNIKPQKYPAILVTSAIQDSQVQYWEPAKWTAKLRELKTDDNPLILYTNMDSGHSGVSGRFEKYTETAMIYTFIIMNI